MSQRPTSLPIAQKGHLLTKKQLADALGLGSTRIIDEWVRKRMVPVFVLGHRTRLFDLEKTKAALAKFERKAVGQ